MTKVLSYGVVGLLAVALLAGTGYILLSPTEAQAERSPVGGQGQVQGQGRGEPWQGDEGMENGIAAYGRGQGRGNGNNEVGTPARTAYGDSEAVQGRGASGAGRGRNETVRTVEWETLTGEVTVVNGEITIQTAEGEVMVSLGQASYREDFALEVGDKVSVTGFHEDGEFKAGSVENLTTGETLVLRDETGRPMWSGQGQRKNQA